MPTILVNDFLKAVIDNFGMYKGEKLNDYGRNLISKKQNTEGQTIVDRFIIFKQKPFYEQVERQFPILKQFTPDVSVLQITEGAFKTLTAKGYLQTKAHNIKFVRNSSDIVAETESYIAQLEKLISPDLKIGKLKQSSLDQIQNFVKDLLIVGYYQSGLSKSYQSFSDIIPLEFKLSFIPEAINKFQALSPSQKQLFMGNPITKNGKTQYDKDGIGFAPNFYANNKKYFSNKSDAKKSEAALRAKGYNFDLNSLQIAAPIFDNNFILGEKVLDGVYVKQNSITKEEQLELFDYLKPFIESQGKKTNKGLNAPVMIGLGLRWDYKSNNVGKTSVNIGTNLAGGNTSYAYYDKAINGDELGTINPRFKELVSKATGINISDYDGAIINVYDNDSLIGNHSDLEESATAEKYPVAVVNLGGSGNIVLGTSLNSKKIKLNSGSGYSFGVNGENRKIPHSTYANSVDGFLPELNLQLENKKFSQGSYRVSITMRRVMPLTENMLKTPLQYSEQIANSVVSSQENNNVNTLQSSSEFTNHSGGAIGADSMFDKIGRELGFNNHNHYWANSKTPLGNKELTNSELVEGVIHAKAAAKELGRPWIDKYANLLGRNWFQVKNSTQVIAIAPIVYPGETNSKGYTINAKRATVDGGTGYAVEMGIANNKEVNVFDTKTNQWYKWNGNTFEISNVPTLQKDFAGIGSRQDNGKMTPESIQAIRNVYEKALANQTKINVKETSKPNIEIVGKYTEEDLAKDNKGKTVQIKYDKYKTGFSAIVTGEVELVSETSSKNDNTGEVTILNRIYQMQFKTTTGKLVTANVYYEVEGLINVEKLGNNKTGELNNTQNTNELKTPEGLPQIKENNTKKDNCI